MAPSRSSPVRLAAPSLAAAGLFLVAPAFRFFRQRTQSIPSEA